MSDQYACLNCERELKAINIYTTIHEVAQVEGIQIQDSVTTTAKETRTLECPYSRFELQEGELQDA